MLDGDGFRLRPAADDDVAALAALAARPEIADSLASVSPWAEDDVRAALAAGRDDEQAEGRYVLEVEEDGGWTARRRARLLADEPSQPHRVPLRPHGRPGVPRPRASASVPSACSPST